MPMRQGGIFAKRFGSAARVSLSRNDCPLGVHGADMKAFFPISTPMFAMMISVLLAIVMVSSKCLNGWRGGTFVGIRSTKSRLRGSLEPSSPSPRSGEPKAKA